MEVKSNAPLLIFECEDMPDEFESSYTLVFQSFQTCLNQKEYSCSQVDDTPTDDEIVVDDSIDSKGLHHASNDEDMPPCSILNEDVVHEDTNHSLEGFSLPAFLSKEEYVIDYIPPLEVIVKTLH